MHWAQDIYYQKQKKPTRAWRSLGLFACTRLCTFMNTGEGLFNKLQQRESYLPATKAQGLSITWFGSRQWRLFARQRKRRMIIIKRKQSRNLAYTWYYMKTAFGLVFTKLGSLFGRNIRAHAGTAPANRLNCKTFLAFLIVVLYSFGLFTYFTDNDCLSIFYQMKTLKRKTSLYILHCLYFKIKIYSKA